MIKKITIIVFILSILFLVSCTDLDNYVSIEKYDELQSAYGTISDKYIEANQDRIDLTNENKNLKTDINNVENETEKYKYLLSSLNELLSNVYYMECSNSEYTNWGTGFSVSYNNAYYILTAGHYIENEYGKFGNFRFKVDNEWIYPELLAYEVTETTPDYAIFYSDKIDNGLKYDINNTEPDYRLGIDIIIQENNNWGEPGSCGSPVIDLDGEVIGIHIGYFQDIDLILEVINNLE